MKSVQTLKTVCFLLTVLLVFASSAMATKSQDKAMTKKAIFEASDYAKAFKDISKAWKKAPSESAEAAELLKKGASAYAKLNDHIQNSLEIFETRRAWYESMGIDYMVGLDFMNDQISTLKRTLGKAQKEDLYQKIK